MSRPTKPIPARRRKPAMSMDVMSRHADEAVAVLKAMGSQHRLMLLCQLLEGEHSVNELADALELAQSVVSQHLSLLRRDGLVVGRREGQSIYYDICDERVRVMMATLFEQFCVDD